MRIRKIICTKIAPFHLLSNQRADFKASFRVCGIVPNGSSAILQSEYRYFHLIPVSSRFFVNTQVLSAHKTHSLFDTQGGAHCSPTYTVVTSSHMQKIGVKIIKHEMIPFFLALFSLCYWGNVPEGLMRTLPLTAVGSSITGSGLTLLSSIATLKDVPRFG